MKIELVGSISDSTSAIKRSGKLAGGGSIVLDVPETHVNVLAALMPLVLLPLRITIEVLDEMVDPRTQPRRGKRTVEEVTTTVVSAPQVTDNEEEAARKLVEQLKAEKQGASTPPRPRWNP